MSASVPLQIRVDDYLAERRQLGFALRSQDTLLASFADFVAEQHHDGPLTADVMGAWARQAQSGRGTRETWYRRLQKLRPFIRNLQPFEPQTEMPEAAIFGPEPGRVAPHIYREEEIVALLNAARQLGPPGDLRAATFEALFGLMAATGVRVCEALHLQDRDVDLKGGVLTVRETEFAKSRQAPLHPSTVAALQRFRRRRGRDVSSEDDSPFFTGTGRHLGQTLGERQVHRVFNRLRDRLDLPNRGAHAAPRLQDLRHNSEFRIIPSNFGNRSHAGGSRAN